METSANTATSESTQGSGWRPLTAKQRRVLGTLMEKSKTTPDAYPMTIASLTTGCNQKTNRSPITNLTSDQVEKVIDEMRLIGALTIIQGSGRVEKIRHYGYQWLGVSKVEAAVMTELLLRGEQTVGELRGRAARMEPIADLNELQNILKPLVERKLVVELTPAGRGQIVSHNLYEEWEMNQLQTRVLSSPGSDEAGEEESSHRHTEPSSSSAASGSQISQLQQQVDSLTDVVNTLSQRLARLEKDLGVSSDDS